MKNTNFHSFQDKVKIYEADVVGIVNNATYLNFLEQCRHEHLTRIGIKGSALQGIDISYQKSLASGQAYAVTSTIAFYDPRTASITFQQTIKCPKTDTLFVRATAIVRAPRDSMLALQSIGCKQQPHKQIITTQTASEMDTAPPYHWQSTVRDHEVNSSGVVSYAVLANYLQSSRHDSLDRLGINFISLHQQGYSLVIANAQIHYNGTPLKTSDKFDITVELSIKKEGKKRLFFEQNVTNVITKERIATAFVYMACVDNRTKKSCLPDFLLAAVALSRKVLSSSTAEAASKYPASLLHPHHILRRKSMSQIPNLRSSL
ncbi:MAG: acyl-CoA thioesterase [Gammaproteobacteria bacterium]|nr:acyl-CoA thioesterase [Gammaproteobacteria bacterium]